MNKTLIVIFAFPLMFLAEFVNINFDANSYAPTSDNIAGVGIMKKKDCSDCHTSIYKKNMHEAAEDCSSCHESVEKKHPKKGVKSFKLVDKVPDLCFACHEENRVMEHVHYPVGEGECLTCHDPHSSRKPGLLIKSNASKLCSECHEMEMHQKEFKHRPVQKGTCQACHDPHQSKNQLLLKNTAPVLCFTCHEDKKTAMDLENIHAPFDDDCSSCHNTHSSDNKHLTTLPMPNLCYECHDDVKTAISEKKFVHKAVNEKSACAGCHDPHASNYGQFLKAEGNKLCLDCHNRDMKGEGYTIRNIKKLIKKEYLHAPVDDGCATCHQAHASDNDMLLTDAFPRGNYTVVKESKFALCFNCHDSALLLESETKVATEFRHGTQNLHSVHVNGDKGRNCNNCHNVHGAENEHLIESNVPFGNWEMPIEYLATDNGGSCATACHSFKEYDRTSDFKPIEELIVESTTEEKVVEEKIKEVVAEVKKVEPVEEPEEATEDIVDVVVEKVEDLPEDTISVVVAETEQVAIEEAIEEPVEEVAEVVIEKEEVLQKDTAAVLVVETEQEIVEKPIEEAEELITEAIKDSVAVEELEIVEEIAEDIVDVVVEKVEDLPEDTIPVVIAEAEQVTTEESVTEPVEEVVEVIVEKVEDLPKDTTAVVAIETEQIIVEKPIEEELVAEIKKDTVVAADAEVVVDIDTKVEIIPEEDIEIEPVKETIEVAVAETTKVVSIMDEYNKLKKLDLTFEFDKAVLKPGLESGLIEMVQFMKKYPDINFEIQGHTDSIGAASYNVYLSEKRAKSVQKILVENGVDKKRIPTKGYGETMPISSNATIKSRSKNRRVEIKPLNIE